MGFSKSSKNVLWQVIIVAAVFLITSGLYYSQAFERFEWITQDQRQRLFRADKKLPSEIAVILIDEASLKQWNAELGRWPWPRSVYADLLDFLSMGEPKAVVFDIILTENQADLCTDEVINIHDQRLIDDTTQFNFSYNAVQILKDVEDERNKDLLFRSLNPEFRAKHAITNARGRGFKTGVHNNFLTPFAGLDLASKGIGAVDIDPDGDGIYRRAKLFREYLGDLYPSLPVSPLLETLNTKDIQIADNLLKIDGKSIPVDQEEDYLFNLYGGINPFSIGGILEARKQIKLGEVDNLIVYPDEFAGKIVFVGASAVGLLDEKPTALSPKAPGVYIHASIAGNILNNDFLVLVKPAVTLGLIFCFSLLSMASIFYFQRFTLQLLSPIYLAAGYVGWALFQYKYNIVYDITAPVAAIIISWLTAFAYLSFTEGKAKRQVRNIFSQYVSPEILNELTENSEDILGSVISRKEHITILFSDVRSFTSISEELEAEQVVDLLNCHFEAMTDVIFNYKGTLDKFIGDAIMAFWGAPIKVKDHATQSVLAAIEMIRRLEDVNRKLREKGYPKITIGIGVNTGEVVLGNIGSEKKLDYTVIGDAVNIASRLEGLTKQYGFPVIISEYTFNELDKTIPCMIVDQVRVKGKTKPVKLFTPLAMPDDSETELDCARHQAELASRGFKLYQDQKWDEAIEVFSTLSNNDLSKVYIDRCAVYKANPPDIPWDGVFTMKTK
ncbi:MAG: adenylate/guanylate cyclase domain-containing protein [Proteobacteria bacterium]|nr:adenylate/guanylate cyclase domain-containing protein [Pseudomonadota bacterium]